MQHISFFLVTICLFLIGHDSGFSQATSGNQYTGRNLQALEVPIGGISTGNILIGGRGNISHLEMFNRPDRQRPPINTFFAINTRSETGQSISKILEREYFAPYHGESHLKSSGLPRIREVVFTNDFPLAHWQFVDEDLPIAIEMEAINPFIPLDVDGSAYPVIEFNWHFTNHHTESQEVSILLNFENPIKADSIVNAVFRSEDLQGIRFSSSMGAEVNYQGNMLMATDAPNVQLQTHLYPGRWRDDMHILWDDFSRDGQIDPREEPWVSTYKNTMYNEISNRNAVVVVTFTLDPGEEMTVPFYLSWYFPDRVFERSETFGTDAAGQVFSNYYKTLFDDEVDALRSYRSNREALVASTRKFADRLQSGTYPPKVIETLTTQAASIRSNLIQMTDAGDVHGFEGVLNTGWCCPGTCTHVWNYEQTLASLFPSMERNMREIEFLYDVDEKGFQNHRSVFPLGEFRFDGGAAADGQMGSITRVYREWKFSGDDDWLRKLWPRVKLALEYAWNMHWDDNKDGMMEGRQHNTYDISFFGPSSMTTSCYLAALKACSEMAKAMGELGKAAEYEDVLQKGIEKMESVLWNGDYFIQIIPDSLHGSLEEDFELSPPNKSGDQIPKYQYGGGCLADQLLGQYIAQNAGLGFIVDEEMTQKAMQAIYENNYIDPIRDYHNVQRVYAMNDDGGVVLCSWPHDDQPVLPFVYAQEVWSGVEFAVAASLIRSGLVREGLEIVEAIQDRHDGFKRNPFMHNESGVHYARAMSSWSVMLALSGFSYDGTEGSLGFDPVISEDDFRTFWSSGNAWGSFSLNSREVVLTVDYGKLHLNRLFLPGDLVVEESEEFDVLRSDRAEVHFSSQLTLEAGNSVRLPLKPD